MHGPFTPSAFPGLAAWYKADLGPLNAAGQVPAPLESIATWVDQSGHGHNLTQPGGAGRQPIYSTGLQNGLHWVSFNGGAPSFSMSAPFAPFGAGGGDGTLIVVFSDRSADGISRIAGQGSLASSLDWALYGTGVPAAHCVFLGAADGRLDTPNALTPDTFYCITGVVAASSSPQVRARTNGVQTASGSLLLPWSGGDNLFVLGSNPATSVFLNGTIAEVVVYNRALSSGELAAVEGYLSSKWGLGF